MDHSRKFPTLSTSKLILILNRWCFAFLQINSHSHCLSSLMGSVPHVPLLKHAFWWYLGRKKQPFSEEWPKSALMSYQLGVTLKKTWCNLANPIISNPQHYLQMRRKTIRRWSKGFVWTWGIPTIIVITKMMSTHDYPIGLGVPSGYFSHSPGKSPCY